MTRILKYVMLDIIKSKLVVVYAILLALLSWSLFSLEDNSAKAVLSLTNVVLLVVPLVTVIFSTIYMYNASEFIELLASQPLKRSSIWIGFFLGLSSALAVALLLGMGLPLLLFADFSMAVVLLTTGVMMSLIFVSLGLWVSALTRDKARGISASIFVWLFFTVIFDGLMLLLLFQFSDYPIERTMIGLTAFSPVDLCRILILLQLDVSALMGFTGALFRDFFGSVKGQWLSFGLLTIWVLIPFYFSTKKFRFKDL
mgnify:CR=1 FL=1